MKLNWMKPHRSSVLSAGTVAVLVMFFGYMSDRYAARHHISFGWDDAVLGVLVGVFVLVHEERRTRAMRCRLRMIRDMNCYVRNELQIIDILAAGDANADRMGMLQNCVEHIDWALRELLPGKAVLEESKPIFEPHKHRAQRLA